MQSRAVQALHMCMGHADPHAVRSPAQANADANVTPPAMLPANESTTLPASSYTVPPQDPPMLPGGACNVGMPGNSTYARYLWVVRCARAALAAL